jgi:hypothetical protein
MLLRMEVTFRTSPSGGDLVSHVRHGSRNRHVPIILLSGADDDDPELRDALQHEVQFTEAMPAASLARPSH